MTLAGLSGGVQCPPARRTPQAGEIFEREQTRQDDNERHDTRLSATEGG